MSWADRAIDRLTKGKSAVIRPRGNSMAPKVLSGQAVTVEPVTDASTLHVGDVVLARVKGNVYLHMVTATRGKRIQIGNARGGINGWTGTVYGKMITEEGIT